MQPRTFDLHPEAIAMSWKEIVIRILIGIPILALSLWIVWEVMNAPYW